MNHIRRISLEHLYNCRDLGGYACEGGVIAWNKLYRSELPAGLTAEEWAHLYEAGVRTVIDLRSLMEAKQMGYEPPNGIERISYPLQKEEAPKQEKETEKTLEEVLAENEKKEAMGAFEKSLSDSYVKMMEECPEKLAGVLNLIAEKLEKGSVLFHCTMGKDRTGVTAALVLLLCGTVESDIVSDYQISAVCMEKHPMMQYIPEFMMPLMTSDPENMKTFLRAAQEKDYIFLLYQNGLKKESVKKIRNIMMER